MPWIPNPENPFDEPEWVTQQRFEYLDRRRKKDTFRQVTRDHSIIEGKRKRDAHEKRIANRQKRREQVAEEITRWGAWS